jgi:hypothetical protein
MKRGELRVFGGLAGHCGESLDKQRVLLSGRPPVAVPRAVGDSALLRHDNRSLSFKAEDYPQIAKTLKFPPLQGEG